MYRKKHGAYRSLVLSTVSGIYWGGLGTCPPQIRGELL